MITPFSTDQEESELAKENQKLYAKEEALSTFIKENDQQVEQQMLTDQQVEQYMLLKQRAIKKLQEDKRILQLKDKNIWLSDYGKQIREKNPNISEEDFKALIETKDVTLFKDANRNFWKQKSIREKKQQDYDSMTFLDGTKSVFQLTKNIVQFENHKKKELARKNCFFNNRIVKAEGCPQFIHSGKCKYGDKCSKIHLPSFKHVSAYLQTDQSHYQIETEQDQKDKKNLDQQNKEYKKSLKRRNPYYKSD